MPYNKDTAARAAVLRTWRLAPYQPNKAGDQVIMRRKAPRQCAPKCMGCVLCGGGRTVPSARENKIRKEIAYMKAEYNAVFSGQEYNKFGNEH